MTSPDLPTAAPMATRARRNGFSSRGARPAPADRSAAVTLSARLGVYLIAIYVVTKMIYLFNEGTAQPADILLGALALLIASPRSMLRFLSDHISLLALLVWIAVVNRPSRIMTMIAQRFWPRWPMGGPTWIVSMGSSSQRASLACPCTRHRRVAAGTTVTRPSASRQFIYPMQFVDRRSHAPLAPVRYPLYRRSAHHASRSAIRRSWPRSTGW